MPESEITGHESAMEETKNFEEPTPEGPGDEGRKWRTPGFQRMRIDWTSEDHLILAQAKDAARRRIIEEFADAYEIMGAIYDTVRTPETDPATGEVMHDQYGFRVWARKNDGGYDEDFTRMTRAHKEDFLFRITTRVFDWEQKVADLWGEAMFARAQWEERYSTQYDEGVRSKATVGEREAAGKRGAVEERYFALMIALVSRQADGVLRSMNLLAQRLKDALTL